MTSSSAIAPSRTAVSDPLVIASVPQGHVYIHHIAPEDPQDPRAPYRLPDPVPEGVPAASQEWWPPRMLTPEWAAGHDFDLFHLHFGFDACSPDQLAELVEVLRERNKPFVYTAHDLRNPHHAERGLHDQHLDVIVPAADAVITLTEGAAREIERRWARDATVIPHPHVVPFETMARLQAAPRREGPFRVGVHLKSVRAGMAPMQVLPALADSVGHLAEAVLQVNIHHDVMAAEGERHDPELSAYLRWASETEQVELLVHDYYDDDALWDYLAALDVSVLPYRFGTHSGWLEACRDLGTSVIAPSCGYYADQGPVHTYEHDEHDFSPASLDHALRRARDEHAGGGPAAFGVAARRRQRTRVAEAHDEIYRALVLGRR